MYVYYVVYGLFVILVAELVHSAIRGLRCIGYLGSL